MLRQAARTGRTFAAQMGRRGLAAEASQEKVALPTNVLGVGGRYANALYMAATKAKTLDQVAKDMKQFETSYNTDQFLKRYVMDPSVSRKAKAETMGAVMKNSSETLKTFVAVLCENGRMDEMAQVMTEFDRLMNAHNKVVFAEVSTAHKLEKADEDAIKDALKGFVKSDESLVLDMKIDDSLLAGMVVTVGDKRIDLSAAKAMDAMIRSVSVPIQ